MLKIIYFNIKYINNNISKILLINLIYNIFNKYVYKCFINIIDKFY